MLFLAVLVSTAFSLTDDLFEKPLHTLPVDTAWKVWIIKFGNTSFAQTYGFNQKRQDIFAYNHAFVAMHNSRNSTFTLALNQFASMTNEEFKQGFTGHTPSMASYQMSGTPHEMQPYASSDGPPESVDWREEGLVTKIKDQGQCGSCWTFSTCVSFEGQYAKLTGNLTSFSEQDILDCVVDYKYSPGNPACCYGCNGGNYASSFEYMKTQQWGFDDTYADYKYTGQQGQCRFTEHNADTGAKIVDWKYAYNYDGLVNAVATVGPISVAINANQFWQFYYGGLLDPPYCPPHVDHAVAVVGYGVYKTGTEYWIVKNSWGTWWGAEGYAYFKKVEHDLCGLYSGPPAYPILEHS